MMFGRILWKLLRGNRGRLAVALVAVTSGATVISGLLNLQFDMREKLTHEFRVLGANVVISHSGSSGAGSGAVGAVGSPALMNQSLVLGQVERLHTADVVGVAPYLYIVARNQDTPVVVAGSWLDEIPKLNPTWKIDGQWIAAREDDAQCIVGRNAARQFHSSSGDKITLNYLGRSATFGIAGVVDTGAAADNQVFVSLSAAQELAATSGQIELVQMSVSGTAASIGSYAAKLASSLPGYDVRPIRQVTEAEGNLLHRTRLLIASMVVLILALTALCVLATMAALAMERREDVGLMKALGGSMARIVGLFLAEVGVLGAAGGLIGSIAGIALARWMGERVFGASITARWEVFPLTIAMMVLASMAGALPLRALGKVKPAVILRGE
jgi:putative ABC transport system permease protein